MLKDKPKSGVKDTALVGMKATAALYKGPDNPKDRPLRVGAKNMQETMTLLEEYGGLDKATAGKVENYYTNAYLPSAPRSHAASGRSPALRFSRALPQRLLPASLHRISRPRAAARRSSPYEAHPPC